MDLITRYMTHFEGPDAHMYGYIAAQQMVLAIWKGAQPIISDFANKYKAQLTSSHSATDRLPTALLPVSSDGAESKNHEFVAMSYEITDEAKLQAQSAPPAAIALLVKVQALWRAYSVRTMHFNRLSTVCNFTNMVEWPQVQTHGPTLKATHSGKKGEVDMENFVPTLPKDMSGDTINQIKAAQDALNAENAHVPPPGGSVATAARMHGVQLRKSEQQNLAAVEIQ
eukprot:gene130-921_t